MGEGIWEIHKYEGWSLKNSWKKSLGFQLFLPWTFYSAPCIWDIIAMFILSRRKEPLSVCCRTSPVPAAHVPYPCHCLAIIHQGKLISIRRKLESSQREPSGRRDLAQKPAESCFKHLHWISGCDLWDMVHNEFFFVTIIQQLHFSSLYASWMLSQHIGNICGMCRRARLCWRPRPSSDYPLLQRHAWYLILWPVLEKEWAVTFCLQDISPPCARWWVGMCVWSF